MTEIELRIRDFFRVDNKLFASVEYSGKGKKEVKSLLRYIEDNNGERCFRGKSYKKLGFFESFDELEGSFIKRSGSQRIQVVPKNLIDEVFRPENYEGYDELIKELMNFFNKKIKSNKLGVTGSKLLDLDKGESDIDFVVYGKKNFNEARKLLKNKLSNGRNELISELDTRDWKKIYKKRRPPYSFKKYLRHSYRKNNKAKIKDTRFDLLFVRDQLPEKNYVGGLGETYEVAAEVINDRYNFDAPAIYGIDHNLFNEVISFTHTYCGQVFEGEKLVARGKKLKNEPVLVAGSTRKPENEYILSKDLDGFSCDST